MTMMVMIMEMTVLRLLGKTACGAKPPISLSFTRLFL
jgi:hypothetical protein